MTMPIVPRDLPTSVRLHLVPELPDQLEELELSESAEWGVSKCVGKSEILFLYQGSRFEFEVQGEKRTLTWHGSRVSATFTFMPDSEPQVAGKSYNEEVGVTVVEGEGRRGGRVAAVAKRAGIPVSGYKLPFAVTTSSTTPPAPPRDVTFYERTQWDFTITWRPPLPSPGNDRPVIKYALELSACQQSGTYGPFEEIWQGMPHTHLVFDDQGELVPQEGEDQPFGYFLNADPALLGRLRLRCWNDQEPRPSAYSEEVKLVRFQGKLLDSKPLVRLTIEETRAEMLGKKGGGCSKNKEKSNSASTGKLKKATMSTATEKLKKDKSVPKVPVATKSGSQESSSSQGKGQIPTPYDVPDPPPCTGLKEGRKALRAFFEEVGVEDGGDGIFMGFRVDHVLHAVASGHTTSTLREPLVVLAEVLYSDILLPMLDTVACLRHEWAFMLEKINGQVQQLCTLKGYSKCVDQLKDILGILFEVRETMRHCDPEGAIMLHLNEKEYTKDLRVVLRKEVLDRMVDILWRLSTQVLRLQAIASPIPNLFTSSAAVARSGSRLLSSAASLPVKSNASLISLASNPQLLKFEDDIPPPEVEEEDTFEASAQNAMKLQLVDAFRASRKKPSGFMTSWRDKVAGSTTKAAQPKVGASRGPSLSKMVGLVSITRFNFGGTKAAS